MLLAIKGRDTYEDLFIQDVHSFTNSDTLLQRWVTVSGTAAINGKMAWAAASGGLRLTGAGQVTILPGSELDVLLGNLHPSYGDSFQLCETSSIVGKFAVLDLPTLGPALSWDANHLYDNGTLRVVPEPTSLYMLILGGLGILGRAVKARRRKHSCPGQ